MKNLSLEHLCVRLILPFVILIFFVISGCRKTESNDANPPDNSPLKVDAKDFKDYRIKFTKALSKALKNEPTLRAFIKEEALLKFDKDYDILYQKVKDRALSDGETLREKLVKYYGDEEDFKKGELAQPLLTIFVPSLPMDSWSAEKWDTQTEVPLVLTGFIEENDEYYCYDGDSVALKIPRLAFPGFPVIALKDNERVTLSKNSKSKVSISSDQFNFSFVDESFDPSQKGRETKSYGLEKLAESKKGVGAQSSSYPLYPAFGAYYFRVPAGQVEPFLTEAYDSGVEWQRDNIYYSLTPTVSTGKLIRTRKEAIRGIAIVTGLEGWKALADQQTDNQDPKWKFEAGSKTPAVEGDFEFRFTFLINSTSGAGQSTIVTFPVKTQDIFDVTWKKTYKPPLKWIWEVTEAKPKVYDPNQIIVTWDLDTKSEEWKVIIDEMDPTETVTQTVTQTSEFATNFEFSPVLSDRAKIGWKFGASAKRTETQTFTYVKQMGDDEIGDYVFNFSNAVVLSYGKDLSVPGQPESPVYVNFPLYVRHEVGFNIRPTQSF